MWVPSYGVNVSAMNSHSETTNAVFFFSRHKALTIYSHPHVFYPALHVLYFKHGDLQKAKIYAREDWEWKGRRRFCDDDDVHKSLGEFNLKPDSCIMNVIKHFRRFHYEEMGSSGTTSHASRVSRLRAENCEKGLRKTLLDCKMARHLTISLIKAFQRRKFNSVWQVYRFTGNLSGSCQKIEFKVETLFWGSEKAPGAYAEHSTKRTLSCRRNFDLSYAPY